MIHVGAAVGPLLAGVMSIVGWQYVFYMLMTANVLALLVRHNLLPFMTI
jgi:MFS family permease